jgi:hypothetical protein
VKKRGEIEIAFFCILFPDFGVKNPEVLIGKDEMIHKDNNRKIIIIKIRNET